MEMSRFEVGKMYRANADSKYLKGYRYEVVKRTPCFVFFKHEVTGEVFRAKPHVITGFGNDYEFCGADGEGFTSEWVE